MLRLCNSVFFGTRARIDSLERALLVLGEKQLVQLVFSASMEDYFSGKDPVYSLCKGGLINHSQGTAKGPRLRQS